MRSFLVSILLVTPLFCLWRWGGLDQIGSHTDRSSGYDRNQYGYWKDFDRDCQNTRHEILIQSSDISIQFKTEKQCLVVSGAWYDPYTSKNFKKAKKIDIDHNQEEKGSECPTYAYSEIPLQDLSLIHI